MKARFQLILFCFLFGISLQAQVEAYTQYGDTVMLMENGTWNFLENYLKKLNEVPEPIDTNTTVFSIPKSASTVKKDLKGRFEIWYDDKTWGEIAVDQVNPQASIAFSTKDFSAYGMIIFEEIEATVESIKSVAVERAKMMTDDFVLIAEEYRKVNDKMILYMETEATISGIKFSYVYYIDSSPIGVSQFICFTDNKSYTDNKPLLIELLNGLVIKNKK